MTKWEREREQGLMKAFVSDSPVSYPDTEFCAAGSFGINQIVVAKGYNLLTHIHKEDTQLAHVFAVTGASC